ncbi:Stk1 family PASTA domain-containing Ser/Thr kinase [Yinghuangia sp. ASG 101]|uniref:Stk1 family PASTA domain-containing Ser/Thr kinase n=1 Tax=Yinghuangia sp. ASG 101 TaxID=2896848 RepID=UPI001E2970E9|nr:Stk1 family PASTA domain-containing Ser/Thr kinase [Yinghuangia sp. ASG 101]UGQ15250.1 Stk1 family PASTA domain-containing Ser/Thr kinase [Yinghuangia sp. ASG 101]
MEEPRRLGDRYEIGAVLGRGGMAEVYLGRDIRLGRAVAVKTLRADLARDPSFQARFRREAQSAASLNHPAIVAVYDTGEDYINGISIPYIVMEYVDGSTLRELLHSGRRLLPERAMEMTAGVLQALEYSHRNGIIHRDIKPANVMLTRQGTVKVMDFGIARAMADNGMTMTQTAAVIGTAQYLSPEQARGETVDARSDLYSTGCLLYELLTERPPFVGDSPVAVAYQHVREDPLPPSTFDPEVSPTIDAIVLKSLAKNPDNRYQSADEMRADLERALHGVPVAAPAVMAPMEAATQYLPATSTTSTQAGYAAPPNAHQQQYDLGPDDDYDDDPPKQRGWAWALLAIACIAVLVAAFFVGKTLLGGGGAGDKKTVPNLVGKTEAEAQQQVSAVSLKLAVDKTESCDQEKGKICSQTPGVDAQVEKDTVVKVVVSSGPELVKVPSVVGKSEEDAQNALKAVGLVGKPDRSTKYDCTKETVCSTDPAANTELAMGTEVVLKINSGKPSHEMPDVVGKTFTSAKKTLEDLKVTVDADQEYSNQPTGTVIAQSVKKGDTVTEGNTVTLTVSQGPSPAPTPTTPTTPPTSETPTGDPTTPTTPPTTPQNTQTNNGPPFTNPFDPRNNGNGNQ